MGYKKLINFLTKTIIIAFGFSFFSMLTLFWERSCAEGNKSKYCNATNIVAYPARTLLSGYYSSLTLLRTFRSTGKLSNTGLISKETIETKNRFIELEPGFNFNYEPGSRPNAGYLILSRANPKLNGKPSVELWDLNAQKKIHEYKFDIDQILNKAGIPNTSKRKLRFVHPLILNDGSLLITSIGGPLVKLDKCGEFMKKNDDFKFHHSLEMSKEGFIYAATNKVEKDLDYKLYTDKYRDEGFAILDEELNVISSFSLLNIYKENDLDYTIYGFNLNQLDPFHLNDVEPYTTQDGNKIALLSLRTHSKVFAFDLNSKKIIWSINGLGFLQHDIDVLSEKNGYIDISFFDNNLWKYPVKTISKENKYVIIKNLPTKYKERTLNYMNTKDFKNKAVNIDSFEWLPKKYRSKTIHEGRSDFIEMNNSLMLEESNMGRIIEVDMINKKVLWQYINKDKKNEAPFLMSWSRRINNLPVNIDSETFAECSEKS